MFSFGSYFVCPIERSCLHASFPANNRVIFNLKGNKHRLDTKVSFKNQVVLVLRIEFSGRAVLLNTTPLFEKERHVFIAALAENIFDPFLLHRACTRPRFYSDDHPMI